MKLKFSFFSGNTSPFENNPSKHEVGRHKLEEKKNVSWLIKDCSLYYFLAEAGNAGLADLTKMLNE